MPDLPDAPIAPDGTGRLMAQMAWLQAVFLSDTVFAHYVDFCHRASIAGGMDRDRAEEWMFRAVWCLSGSPETWRGYAGCPMLTGGAAPVDRAPQWSGARGGVMGG